MLQFISKWRTVVGKRSSPRRSRESHYGPRFESLENRTLLTASTNVVMESLVRLQSTTIQYSYEVQNAALPGPFTVNFYRSSDATFDPGDVLIGTDTATEGSVGDHTSEVVTLTAGYAPDLTRKFMLAVATGVPSTDTTADLRIYILGAVTHGDAPTGKFPAWVPYVAKQLDCLKYDATIAFDWSKLAAIPKPGFALLAVDLMAKRVLDTMKQVAPQGSWDLQLIGHSRGGTIISLTMDKLVKSNSPLLSGYKRLTYLDSHPANAGTDSLFNYLPQPTLGKALAGRVAYGFARLLQHSINDPSSFVPQGVDYAEAYFQKSLAWKVQYQPQEVILNLWGESNIPTNGPAVHSVDVTADGMSHTGVWRLYANSITQTLPTSLRTETTFVPAQPYNFKPLPVVPPCPPAALAVMALWEGSSPLKASLGGRRR